MMMCTFRLDEALVERLDAYASKMSEKQPGMTFTRADAVRILLEKSLSKPEALAAAKKSELMKEVERKMKR